MSFDSKAKDWDKDTEKVKRAELFAGEIVSLTDGEQIDTALEFGSGTGLVSFFLKERFTSIILADNSKGMTEVLKEKISAGKVTNMKPFLISERNTLESLSGIGIVYTLMTLHHVTDTIKLFGDFAKILLPGGWLVAGDLFPEDGSFHGHQGFQGHKGFNPEELILQLSDHGFTEAKYKSFYTISRKVGSFIKTYPLFILSARKKKQ